MPRRTKARLAQLREHLNRTRWRDRQAAETYWLLNLAQKPVLLANLASFDKVLKDYYNEDYIKSMSFAESHLLAFLKRS